MKKLLFIFTFSLLATLAFAQEEKRPLTFDDILKWNRITETHISHNGKYIVYKEEPWKGDPVLKITTPAGEEKASIPCGTGAEITADSRFLVFTLKAPEDSVRLLKLKKTKKEDLPKDKLAIYDLTNDSQVVIDQIKSYKVPEEWSGWIAYQAEQADTASTSEKKEKKNDKDEALPLVIKNLLNGAEKEFPAVNSYEFAEENELLAFVSEGDSVFDAGVYVFNFENESALKILDGKGEVKQLTLSKSDDKLAFLADTTDSKKKKYALYYWEGNEPAAIIVDNQNNAIPEGWEISPNGQLSFSENNERLFFGTAPQQPEKDSTILEEEIPVLDIWNWKEEQLQTVQLYNKPQDEKKTYLAVVHLANNKAIQLETELFSGIDPINKGNADQLLAYSNHPYAVQTMWEGQPYHLDFYLVDINTGAYKMIKKDCRARPMSSPDGNYLYWYNAIDTTWNSYNITSGQEFVITLPQQIQVADELNDIPNPPSAYGSAGWLKDDKALLIYDRYDLWQIDPENKSKPINLTQNGRAEKISYRLVRFNAKRGEAVDPSEKVLLKAFDEKSKADSYYSFDLEKPGNKKTLLKGNFMLSIPDKAEDAELLVFTKQNFQTYPNLLATDLSFKKQVQLSDAAPQQKDFIWGTAELVSWRSLDGLVLEGTLHKPENFDSNKKYPMIVNFYEKSSDELLSYHMPENHRSTIDYHYYTSNGYVVFNPDVYYKEGYPGESAFNCVMPGVNHIVKMGFVDPKRIGAQGHSWGGYQVAYLATRTNMFSAIESGAPVVNMFSAYGGIRWGSGMNRSFQYEHTQSRIGKSIWEAPLRYLENSPLFTLDKIQTPILIMHNDDDGAVPWYQGIEFFVGLRRLGKPSWLLNYNEADHWPLKIRDKHDFQIRMAQFFDHYLKNAPMPVWMKEGIPATKKGIEMGYELTK
ncbi:prolyl oligopeptidase family serine peptidase [Maribellus sp. YY47]|uniref:alpha/beta hydrolase family protein n=1 Tax=Maribellus sp. YY47 TaxID=2929486 RepID=UPI0020019B7B|nr:prolyl oligopeptidase family serine peptidase [Maribellus sp. YY47]MCK3684551.1 prolyl oligopeptidase family serine peptidase [Maribellus sp. YY47]